MKLDDLDRMTEHAVTCLSSNDADRIGALVRDLASGWPAASGLGLAFAITSAAAQLEDVITDPVTDRSAARAYKLAALVAADILALEAMGSKNVSCADLMTYWKNADPYFLDL